MHAWGNLLNYPVTAPAEALATFTSTIRHSVVVHANSIQFARGDVVAYPQVESRMLLVCEEGTGGVTVNGHRHPLAAGRLMFLPWRHSIRYQADRLTPFLLSGIHMIPWYEPDQTVAFGVAHGPGQDHHGSPHRSDRDLGPLTGVIHGSMNRNDRLDDLVRLTLAEFRSSFFDTTTANSLARLILRELWLLQTDARGSVRSESPEDTLGSIERYVLDHLSEPISVQDLCRLSAMSQSTLRRRFVKTLGVSPYEWVVERRIEEAERLLSTQTIPVREIAARVGIPDAAYFSRVFTRRAGLTPRAYRKRHLNL